jgi:hypothetical protein
MHFMPEMSGTPGTTIDMIQGNSTTGQTTTTSGDGADTVIAALTTTLFATDDLGTTTIIEDTTQGTTMIIKDRTQVISDLSNPSPATTVERKVIDRLNAQSKRKEMMQGIKE